jgi:hypothetical protein
VTEDALSRRPDMEHTTNPDDMLELPDADEDRWPRPEGSAPTALFAAPFVEPSHFRPPMNHDGVRMEDPLPDPPGGGKRRDPRLRCTLAELSPTPYPAPKMAPWHRRLVQMMVPFTTAAHTVRMPLRQPTPFPPGPPPRENQRRWDARPRCTTSILHPAPPAGTCRKSWPQHLAHMLRPFTTTTPLVNTSRRHDRACSPVQTRGRESGPQLHQEQKGGKCDPPEEVTFHEILDHALFGPPLEIDALRGIYATRASLELAAPVTGVRGASPYCMSITHTIPRRSARHQPAPPPAQSNDPATLPPSAQDLDPMASEEAEPGSEPAPGASPSEPDADLDPAASDEVELGSEPASGASPSEPADEESAPSVSDIASSEAGADSDVPPPAENAAEPAPTPTRRPHPAAGSSLDNPRRVALDTDDKIDTPREKESVPSSWYKGLTGFGPPPDKSKKHVNIFDGREQATPPWIADLQREWVDPTEYLALWNPDWAQTFEPLYASTRKWQRVWRQGKGRPHKGWHVRGNLLYRTGIKGDRLCVPCPDAQIAILKLLHDSSMAGHGGVTKTVLRLQERYYWAGQ